MAMFCYKQLFISYITTSLNIVYEALNFGASIIYAIIEVPNKIKNWVCERIISTLETEVTPPVREGFHFKALISVLKMLQLLRLEEFLFLKLLTDYLG